VRKVAVFNDTAPSRHFGCEAVMAAIEINVSARGGHIIHRHAVGKLWETDPAALAAIEDADEDANIVLVKARGRSTRHAGGGARLRGGRALRDRPDRTPFVVLRGYLSVPRNDTAQLSARFSMR
jgi:hypothetical protein